MDSKGLIKAIKVPSIAHEIGLLPGDILNKIDGQSFKDYFEYKFMITDEELELEVDRNGTIKLYHVYKDFDDDLGIEFEKPLLDDIKRCKNRCIFCFVDQMPKGLRKTLYVKDDDYRLSLMSGTYISLTNLSQQDLKRIVTLGISPLYVSVHATCPETRKFLLRNPDAVDVMEKLRFFADNGISVHCQVVLCPGINDGEILDKTISDLSTLCPNVLSIALVPVGLTKYREGLYPVRPYTKMEAEEIITKAKIFQQSFLDIYNTRLVFLADEFYIKAGIDIPCYEAYETFCQLEDGIGLLALLKKQLDENIQNIPEALHDKRNVSIVTGYSAAKYLQDYLSPLLKIENFTYNIFPIVNDFFGSSVTVTGLICGVDIVKQLKNKKLGDEVLIPEVMLKDKTFFLDDMTIDELENILDVKLTVVDMNGSKLLETMLGIKLEEKP